MKKENNFKKQILLINQIRLLGCQLNGVGYILENFKAHFLSDEEEDCFLGVGSNIRSLAREIFELSDELEKNN